MNRNLSKLLRTLQVQFPSLLETKFRLMRLYRNGLRKPFEGDFTALPLLFPSASGRQFLDVGANRGQSTDAILMMLPDVEVHQFEPNPFLVAKLRRMFSGNARVATNAFGLGDEPCTCDLVVPHYNGWMFDGLASFEHEEAASWLRTRLFGFDERKLVLHKHTCDVKRLDDLRLKPAFIKLDVQGYEYKALVGGMETLRAHRPVILIESPEKRTVELLTSLGYGYYTFRAGKFHAGVIGTPNTFFLTAVQAGLVKDRIVGRMPAAAASEPAVATRPVAVAAASAARIPARETTAAVSE